MPVLYLASKSPRRREILASMGITDIEVITVGPAQRTAFEGDEVQLEGEAPEDYVSRTALTKARAALAPPGGRRPVPVLAADTVVILDDVILGKTVDRNEARDFMKRLSGRTHEVRTVVVTGTSDEDLQEAVSVSKVTFARLSDETIERYIALDEPYDKAGGYGIQGAAGLFISSIEGSYTGIMGLPVYETGLLLRPLGLTVV